MKRIFTLFVAVVSAMTVFAQSAELFKPYQPIDLRLPSVPIIVNDPYFSIWSPYDKLTDGSTRHWTDAQKAIDGLLRVDGTTYRFMGVERPYVLQSIMAMADEGAWTARTSRRNPGTGWADTDFDDSQWATERGAFGTPNEYPNVNTSWTAENSDVYARRTVTLTAEDIASDLYVVYSHDDVFELYINGTRVVSTGETWLQGETHHLSDAEKALLKEGDNVIAAHCHNTTGGALLDYGLYKNLKTEHSDIQIAKQTSVDVLATNTYYTFECGPVMLDVVFTAPMLMDDLDLLSTPINYVSYQVRSNDGADHNVQFYLATSPELTVNQTSQPTISRRTTQNGTPYLYTGTVEQPVLKKAGDLICIDWGYLYMPGFNGELSLASTLTVEHEFASTGKLPTTQRVVTSHNASDMPALAYMHDFGTVKEGSSFTMLGYNETYDITYMGRNYKGYWARNGKTIFSAFQEMYDNYADIMARCRRMDQQIYDDGLAAGNKKYAELLSASYRQVIAAHKLFEDKDGHLLYFSKENNSNGCVNTVDLTYPSAPLFLLYNPELQKGMMTSIFEYSYTGRWTKPFAAHDIGTYPIANGQVYGGDMPLEESGNMITLAAMICRLENSTSYVDKYWDIIKTWTDYLVENGQDPANQLCTDDFAGHWAHNANLSIKAIMGVAGFAEMARIKGDEATATQYMDKAKEMARIWESTAREGDHYRLAFDRANTWSQKYNMVWDKLWNIHIFPTGTIERDLQYYLNKQNTYGLPLDSREAYSKSDWILWTASMAQDKETFLKFSDPVWKYVNETRTRVPICDWYWTNSGDKRGFMARSVIGGHWMKVLMDKYGTVVPPSKEWAPAGNKMKTRWTAEVNPDNVLPEYPRPLLQRGEWVNLNGLWQYGFNTSSSNTEPSVYDGEILVPFALESSLSGVMQPMSENNALWYKREFAIPEEWNGRNVRINFGGVDNNARVYVNGNNVSTHTGGFSAFSADITRYLNAGGTNVITVKVTDATDGTSQPLGKQRKDTQDNGSIWHSPVSGIWQTVWLEPVAANFISDIKTTPDVDNHRFVVNATTNATAADAVVKVVLKDGSDVVAEGSGAPGTDIVLSVNSPKLWTPQTPHLYDMEASLTVGGNTVDNVSSYAAMRKISVARDKDGVWRMQLNNENLFQAGVIDQGYWPDGLYTAPTDEALASDIEAAKNLGYNMIRKHMKVEPARWYYHCDRLGMLVWQDMPALSESYEEWNGTDWYTGTDGRPSSFARTNYRNEWTAIINQHYSNPSIVVWTPFNEAWGQFTTKTIVSTTRNLDDTRLIDAASGGNHHAEVGDMLDLHDMSDSPSVFLSDDARPVVLGQYGALKYNVEGYRWVPEYAETTYTSGDELTDAYTAMTDKVEALAAVNEGKAFSAAVYSQLTDVETEHDGLITYDRKLVKVDAAKVRAANDKLTGSLTPTGIDGVTDNGSRPVEQARYNVSGQRVQHGVKGVNIVRYSDGTTRKTVIK
ncbi:MAG: glutaminase domain-containing protein [Prevotella sp.]